MFQNVTSSNLLLYAAHVYDNPQCVSLSEFQDDIRRFKYMKRLFRQYHETGVIKERLLLNHLILLANVFPPPHLARLLFCKMEPEYYSLLKTSLESLSLAPPVIHGVNGQTINVSEIPIDLRLSGILNKM